VLEPETPLNTLFAADSLNHHLEEETTNSEKESNHHTRMLNHISLFDATLMPVFSFWPIINQE
jgi:hypothetical protein